MNFKLEIIAKWLIATGILVILIGIVIFLWNEWYTISAQKKINDVKFGGFGSFISGVVGTLWALAGVILFYVALKDQRADIQLNRDALQLQIQALEQQIEEFRLQTQELEETRKVFIDQTKTQKLQRFENTFFQLITLHNEIVNNLVKPHSSYKDASGRQVFHEIKHALDQFTIKIILTYKQDGAGGSFPGKIDKVKKIEDVEPYLIKYYYINFYKEYEDTLNHYFRNLYHIFKYVHSSQLVDENERKFYSNIMRAQLSQNELYILLFNSLMDQYGFPRFAYLIRKYELLQNFNPDNVPNNLFLEYFKIKTENLKDPFL